jgi:hypothetical protein
MLPLSYRMQVIAKLPYGKNFAALCFYRLRTLATDPLSKALLGKK